MVCLDQEAKSVVSSLFRTRLNESRATTLYFVRKQQSRNRLLIVFAVLSIALSLIFLSLVESSGEQTKSVVSLVIGLLSFCGVNLLHIIAFVRGQAKYRPAVFAFQKLTQNLEELKSLQLTMGSSNDLIYSTQLLFERMNELRIEYPTDCSSRLYWDCRQRVLKT